MFLLPEPTFKPLRVYSDGGGAQSVAAMVLTAQGRMNFDVFVFANVGEDSENPETLAYRQEYVLPFAEQHGLKLIERRKWNKDGTPDTVYSATLEPDGRSIPIPIVFPGQGFGNRKCTTDFKVEVVNRYIRNESGATHAVMALGFTLDEGARIYKKYRGWHDHNWSRKKGKPGQSFVDKWVWNKKRLGFWRLFEFPLADLRLNRAACEQIVQDAGLPPVPKSACWFCPFTSRSVWIDRKRNRETDPIYDQALQFQADLNVKYQAIRSTHPKASSFVSIHRDGIALEDVGDQASMYDLFADQDEDCETGYCGV